MKTIRLLYKCRSCGAIDQSLSLGDHQTKAIQLMIEAIHEAPSTMTQAPRLMGLHNCAAGSLGVTDLIGYKTTEDQVSNDVALPTASDTPPQT